VEKIDLVIAQTEGYDIIILQKAPVSDEIIDLLQRKNGNHIYYDSAADNKSAAIITIINQCLNASNVVVTSKIITSPLMSLLFPLSVTFHNRPFAPCGEFLERNCKNVK
jgi:hypothetical protein